MFATSHKQNTVVPFICVALIYILTVNSVASISRVAPPHPSSPKIQSPFKEKAENPALEKAGTGHTASRLKAIAGKLPLTFEANQGQTDEQVKFIAHGAGYNLFLTSTEAVIRLRNADFGLRNKNAVSSAKIRIPQSAVVRMKLIGASRAPQVEGTEAAAGTHNYFTGDDPAQWRVNVPGYARVRYSAVYPGVDLVYYGKGRELEYDFIVAPGANTEAIKLVFDGADKPRLDARGDLILKSGANEMRMRKPVAYQEFDGVRRSVPSRYALKDKRQIGFALGDYDHTRPLIIDPVVIVYATYLGGSDQDFGNSIAVDADGNTYVTGLTYSTNFPTRNAVQPSASGGGSTVYDAFISKLSADGSTLIYSTYLGGSDNFEEGRGIAVDAAGNAYVTGNTRSNNFPTTANALQPTGTSGDLQNFVTKLGANGATLLYSSYLGTSRRGVNGVAVGGIAVDSNGNAYITGATDPFGGFPIKNGFQTTPRTGSPNAFLTRINTNASGANSLVYSTYLHGGLDANGDYGNSVAVDNAGNAYVAGFAASSFPTKNAFQSFYGGNGDVFLAKLNTNAVGADSLLYATYLGGSFFDGIRPAVAIDSSGNAYVTGDTFSSDFPTKNAYQPFSRGAPDVFVTKINPSLSGADSLLYSTYLGGSLSDTDPSIAVDSSGNAYIAGRTGSVDFPLLDALPSESVGSMSSFVAKFSTDASDLLYSTYFSGSINSLALDAANNVYLTGFNSGDLPATPGAYQTTTTNTDAFISKLSFTESADLSISAITPDRGGDTGIVRVKIRGASFSANATVKLVMAGEADITASNVRVIEDGRIITATFDLRAQARGLRNVVVTNPDGISATLENAFTIEEGRAAQPFVDIISRPAFRPGRAMRYGFVVGNRGNVTALGVMMMISGIPKNADVQLDFALSPTPLPPELEEFRSDDVSPILESETEKFIPLFFGAIPTGGVINFNILISVPGETPFTLKAEVSQPFFELPSTPNPSARLNRLKFNSPDELKLGGLPSGFNPAFNGKPIKPQLDLSGLQITEKQRKCIEKLLIFVLKKIFKKLIKKFVPVDCVSGLGPGLISSLQATVEAAASSASGGLSVADGAAAAAKVIVPPLKETIKNCAEAAVGVALPELAVAIAVVEITVEIYTDFKIISDCICAFQPPSSVSRLIRSASSFDPNDKLGSEGTGAARYISGEEPSRYAVFFENLATATAPAQEVTITDQLDVSKFDLSTFSFGTIGFGDTTISPEFASTQFSREVDLRPANNLIVRVGAELDTETGLITWRFTSLDPQTREPTEDPLAGFLPPNRIAPEGDGFVTFTVKPRAELVTGDELANGASIVFDTNAPILTPVWTNTIDNTPPTSQVLPLAATQTQARFEVSWSGSDTESGIHDYTIYVSENGSPYQIWLPNTPNTSDFFNGQPGGTYSFFSVAADGTNNRETQSPERSIPTVVSNNAMPAISTAETLIAEPAFGTMNAVFVFRLSAPSTQSVRVNYTTTDGTASAGRDYRATTGTLTFAPGSTEQTLAIEIFADRLTEEEETFFVVLNKATNATFENAQAEGTIYNTQRKGREFRRRR